MEYLSEESVVIFTGNALAVREEMTLSADRMEVTLADEKGGEDEGSVSLIVATGSVNVRQVVPPTGDDKAPKERFATGERGEYDGAARTVTLTGSPRLWEGKNIITGEKMIFHIDDHRFVVQGKVGLSIFPERGLEK
jgi:lipopolysaccharide export system protein LptA